MDVDYVMKANKQVQRNQKYDDFEFYEANKVENFKPKYEINDVKCDFYRMNKFLNSLNSEKSKID